MASPYASGPTAGTWSGRGTPQPQPQYNQQPMPAAGGSDFAMQTRPMGVKVLYSFRDSTDNCLARWPQVLPVQTVSLDGTNSIGIIDLRLCLQAIAQCSPEILDQPDMDYTVYALDYSETDTPLVGQGMFSKGLQPAQQHEEPKMVTGRVTKNLLGVFGGGSRETLEVKLRLSSVARRRTDYPPQNPDVQAHQPQPQHQQLEPQYQQQPQQHQQYPQHQQPLPQMPQIGPGPVSTPTDASEWNSFIQSNPNLGRPSSIPPQQNQQPQRQGYVPASRPGSVPLPPSQGPVPGTSPARTPRIDSMPTQSTAVPVSNSSFTSNRSGTPDVSDLLPAPAQKPSRPSSRSRNRPSTGRPRGRPRKKPIADGNTSTAEDPTDADDGPQRKRAKTTQADWSEDMTPLDRTADSLRVTAAMTGSVRALRPVGNAPSDGVRASHLHEGPRAPTPVPQGLNPRSKPGRKPTSTLARRDSMASADDSMAYPPLHREASTLSNLHPNDARSPTESIAPSDQAYTPEASPADLGSSPPVPRATAFMGGSSPLISSPALPRILPNHRQDSGFMSGGIDGGFEDDELPQSLPPQKPQPQRKHAPQPKPPKIAKPIPRKGNAPRQYEGFPFEEVIPGPQELLPKTSLYNPPYPIKPQVDEPQQQQASGSRTLKRTNIEPRPPKASTKQFPDARANTTPSMLQPAPQPRLVEPQVSVDQPIPSIEASAGQPNACPLPNEVRPEGSASHIPETRQDKPQNSSFQHGVLLNEQTKALGEATSISEPALPPMNPINKSSQQMGLSDEQIKALEEAASMPEPELPTIRPSGDPRPGQTRTTDQRPEVPASEPVNASMMLTLPQMSFSEAPCPPSEPPQEQQQEQSMSNKNYVKKQTIKDRLEQAILSGEMPPFCTNCGAIETPTWRKMWTQDHEGEPSFYDYSEKPGQVTAIDILKRDEDEKVLQYRLVKKSLAPGEDKKKWNELLLCNPCGIWLSKFKSHRPSNQWDKTLNQPRKKRDRGAASGSRAKKQRTKSDTQPNSLTFDNCYMTDPLGPGYDADGMDDTNNPPTDKTIRPGNQNKLGLIGSPNSRGPGSTHSRGSGTAQSPIALEDGLGQTRRLLFPSPRKDGVPKVLCEMAVNIVKTGAEIAVLRDGKITSGSHAKPVTPSKNKAKDMADLFGTPPARPTTPPPNPTSGSGGPFKTPTRPTPSHRPITRSISKSIRSARVLPMSPSQALVGLQGTPTRTPRRTPNRQHLHAHFALDENVGLLGMGLNMDYPLTPTLTQLLSEANDFTTGSPSHGLGSLDLQPLPGDDCNMPMDFGNFLSADLAMPSSPPLLLSKSLQLTSDAAFESWDLWTQIEQGAVATNEGETLLE